MWHRSEAPSRWHHCNPYHHHDAIRAVFLAGVSGANSMHPYRQTLTKKHSQLSAPFLRLYVLVLGWLDGRRKSSFQQGLPSE